MSERDPEWFREHYPETASLLRKNWSAIDDRLCAEIKREAKAMRQLVPLVRVSARQILLKVGKLSWQKRALELPRTLALLASIDEPVDQYQNRRVAWAIREMVAQGKPLSVTMVAQKARIEAKCFHKIRDALRSRSD